MALPEEYRDYFIRNLHDALSGHTSNNVTEAVRYQCPMINLSMTDRIRRTLITNFVAQISQCQERARNSPSPVGDNILCGIICLFL